MVRETLEEIAWQFQPQAIVGIYLWKNPANEKSFLRVAYTGIAASHDPHRRLDRAILRVHWLTRDQLLGRQSHLHAHRWFCVVWTITSPAPACHSSR